jgi:phosphatidate cytidylyltransferase
MLITRIITALALLAVVIPALFIAPLWVWQLVVLVFLALAGFEWGRMIGTSKSGWILAATLFAAGLIFTINPPSFSHTLNVIAAGFVVLASLFWLLVIPFALRPSFSAKTGGLLLAFVLLLATWLAVTQLRVQGAWYVLSCLLIVWIADTFAYFSGRTFGKKKLAPSISQFGFGGESFPKTVGLFAGILGSIAVAIVMTAYSVMGDLFESKLKREVGVKDSGNTLPGHGGVLDRIDAVIVVLPICWVIDQIATGRLFESIKLAAF